MAIKSNARHIVIGDTHGCYAELKALLTRLGIRSDDHVVSLGDVLDKGPDAHRVIEYLRSRPGKTTLVRGNHELDFLLRAHGSEPWIRRDSYESQRALLSQDDMIWLGHSQPSYSFTSGGRQFVCVHAGIPSNMRQLPAAQSRSAWSEKAQKLTHHGFEGRRKKDYWADAYDGRFGIALFGHRRWEDARPKLFELERRERDSNPILRAVGLDGGCVYGGSLLAAVIEHGEIVYYMQRAFERYYGSA